LNPIGILSTTPPFSSMLVQHLESGFVCVVPPGSPLVARTSGEVATAVHLFLGQREVSELSSASQDAPLSVLYEWGDATVNRGAVFNVSKVARVKKGRLIPNGGFMLTYHMAEPGTQSQVAAFNRATVMDYLRRWITTPLPSEEVRCMAGLLTLAGMRPNPDMDEHGDTTFVMQVAHTSQVASFSGPCPFVARCEDPKMAIGIVDEEVVGYIAEELGEDLEGEFAVRVHEAFLEFGPRLEDDDDPERDCFG